MQMLSSSKFDIYAKQNQAWYEGKDKLGMAEVCERISYRWKKTTWAILRNILMQLF